MLQGMVDEDLDVKQFCNRHVEVMGTESDHIHIVALSDALQVPPPYYETQTSALPRAFSLRPPLSCLQI